MYFWEHFRISACWLGFSLAHWDERLKNQRSCGGPSRSSMSTSHTVWTFGPGLVVAKVIIVLVFDWSVKWLEWLNSLSRSRSVIADGEMEHKIRLHEASVSRRTNEKPGPAQGLNLSSTRNIREPQAAFEFLLHVICQCGDLHRFHLPPVYQGASRSLNSRYLKTSASKTWSVCMNGYCNG